MKYAIVHLYHHNNWANSRLLDFVEAQAPALLEETLPGSYGTIGETLVHLAAAQARSAVRLPVQTRRMPLAAT